MAAICTKEFALHVGPAVSLVDYWDFDDGAPPFIAELDPDDNFQNNVGVVAGGAAGILNTCMRISGVPLAGTASIQTTANPLIKPTHGFTWTTWVNFTTFGSENINFEIHFLNALNVEVINFRSIFGPGFPPKFIVIQKNNATFFSPTASFGAARWIFIQVQYDATTKKFGVQRGDAFFGGLGGMEESLPIADDLSAVTKGYLVLKGVNTGTSPDYRQDESGFWARLLTNAEVIQLYGGGTPPAYPAIPQ